MVILKNKKYEKSCGVIVVNDNNQILLVKHNLGHYGFPKGHMEKGESEIETAIREVKEETNIDVSIYEDKRYIINYDTNYNTNKDVIYFLGYPKNQNTIPQEKEISEALWIDIDEVSNYLEFPNIISLWNNTIIKEIKKYKEN